MSLGCWHWGTGSSVGSLRATTGTPFTSFWGGEVISCHSCSCKYSAGHGVGMVWCLPSTYGWMAQGYPCTYLGHLLIKTPGGKEPYWYPPKLATWGHCLACRSLIMLLVPVLVPEEKRTRTGIYTSPFQSGFSEWLNAMQFSVIDSMMQAQDNYSDALCNVLLALLIPWTFLGFVPRQQIWMPEPSPFLPG